MERSFGPSEVRVVDLREVRGIKEFDDAELLFTVRLRLATNYADTGHPYHHLTADGTVVDTDPTLEYAIARLSASSALERDDPRQAFANVSLAHAKPAIPVNRMFYGFDMYADDTTDK